MGWYLRKSLNFGGLRLNFSKSGVGMSAGMRGLRFGVSPSGRRYVHCGRGGIYYRKSFGAAGSPAAPPSPRGTPGHPSPVPSPGHSPVIPSGTVGPQQVIDSSDVSRMVDSSAIELLAEIQRRHRRIRLHRWFLVMIIIGGVLAGAQEMPDLAGVCAAIGVVGTPLLWFLDRRRKLIHLQYDLDADYERRYRQLLTAFEHLSGAQRVWLVETEAAVLDRKYHGGANSSITRTAVRPHLSLPPYFKGNVTPPMLPAGRQRLYFLPDVVLVFDGNGVGAVGYPQLQVEVGTTRFIESEWPPRDAQQVGQTWQYVNKKGGPDRRFANNRQLPVMQYGVVRWRSTTGLNEEFHVSRVDAGGYLDAAVRVLAVAPRQGSARQAAPAPPPPPLPRSGRAPWPSV